MYHEQRRVRIAKGAARRPSATLRESRSGGVAKPASEEGGERRERASSYHARVDDASLGLPPGAGLSSGERGPAQLPRAYLLNPLIH